MSLGERERVANARRRGRRRRGEAEQQPSNELCSSQNSRGARRWCVVDGESERAKSSTEESWREKETDQSQCAFVFLCLERGREK
jgi:hypothetical protein